MNTPTHIRRFVVPTVRELGLSGAGHDVPPETRVTRPTQRSLVAASLLFCPGRAGRG
ncbi:hypothetical protein [Solirubrobacter soli]|uniref:hypothetical protein n=1 Tax=Solirubrobacter soli TaxID=363832 RepID=UPI0012F761AE|nr:hypothetical protein [Solirubrobacter soli]